ncbi:hypothetical protein M011DRAFT_248978 [Sporormia fimetaria CBS 119925]|uniref:Uncharacterized protein n=1 Tax=Sporormia fimetaria CBS 119925 TaxID=1340428 RepID=A0A6A6UXV4_9PLEO|nr:hypothetical protein M011DRAFT_248978 [Sporormia fimetaria CBS 119925]
MGDALAEATELKIKGNDAFKNHDWPTAIDLYTKAIEKYDKEPSFYTNRAQAHIKLEAYGFAVQDANKAIELNPNNVKVLSPDEHSLARTALTKARRTTAAHLPTRPSSTTATPSETGSWWSRKHQTTPMQRCAWSNAKRSSSAMPSSRPLRSRMPRQLPRVWTSTR